MTAVRLVATTCSACSVPVVLDPAKGEARTRGALAGVDLFHDDELLVWDCPACGYSDSYSAASS